MSEPSARHRLGVAVSGVLVASIAVLAPGAVPAAGAPSPTSESTAPVVSDHPRMMLLLDSSGSMAEPAGGGGTKIEAARDALGQVIEALPDEAAVGVRVFGATVPSVDQPGACQDSQRVVDLGTSNRSELQAAIRAYEPFGETPIGFALREAGADLGNEGARSIVLVSDGLADCEPDPCLVAAELRAQGVDLRIDVVGLGVDDDARAQLRCIAAQGGGTYYDASSAEEIVDSLTTATERALRPFEIVGTPVNGSSDPADAPEVALGTYVEEPLRSDDTENRWYRFERTIPGSTVFVTAFELVPGSQNSTYLTVESESGTSCGTGPSPVGSHAVFTGYTRVIPPDEGEGCDGDLLIELRVNTASEESDAIGLSFAEEPPALNAASLPEPRTGTTDLQPVTVSASAQAVVPGSTFDDAAELQPGQTYNATIVPGEVHAFRVSVGWGQRLVARVDDPGLTEDQNDALPTFAATDLQILTPLRSSLWDYPEYEDVDLPSSAALSGAPSTNYVATAPVQWRNREDENGSMAYLAGDYYVVYQADFDGTASVELPYTITVEVQGDVSGEPGYADGQELLFEQPTAEPEASASPEPPAAGEERGDGIGSGPALLVAAAILATVSAGGLVWWLRRRRSRQSADAG